MRVFTISFFAIAAGVLGCIGTTGWIQMPNEYAPLAFVGLGIIAALIGIAVAITEKK